MPTEPSQSYQQAARDLVDRYELLLTAPRDRREGVLRVADDLPADHFVQVAAQIVEASADLTSQAVGLMQTGSPLLREGVSAQLIAQAAAEMQLAGELLSLTDEGSGAQPRAGVTRSTRGSALRAAIDGMREASLRPVEEGLAAYLPAVRRAAPAVADAESAVMRLRTSVTQANRAIMRQAVDLSNEIALDLVMQTRWAAVLDGALLLRGEAAAKLGEIKKGLGGLIENAAGTAEKALLNIYDKLLVVLGKDTEDKARKQIREWLEKIKNEGKIDVLEELVAGLYRVSAFQEELENWLKATSSPADKVARTAGEVDQVAQKYVVLCKQIDLLENAVGLAKLTGIPQVLIVVAGLQVGMLAVVIYSGYDAIGYQQKAFLDITRGVAQVVRDGLALR